MQDKPVIDDIECRYWFRVNPRDYRKCSLRGGNDNCDEIKDCFIKELLGKLALKDQECEELKERLNSRCFDPKNNNNRCISYNRIAEDYERDLKQLDRLKAENEEYKKDNQAMRNSSTDICFMRSKLFIIPPRL